MPKSRSRRKPAPRPVPQRRPAPPPVPVSTAPGLRGAVERRSAPTLAWLSRRKLLLPLGSLALLIGGFLAPPGLAVVLLVALLAVMTWLTYLSWPAVDGRGRALRGATLGLIVLAVAIKLTRATTG